MLRKLALIDGKAHPRGRPSPPARLLSGGKILAADLNLTAAIDGAGYKPERMRTQAQVHWRPSVAAHMTRVEVTGLCGARTLAGA
jgi:hypothetical protein